MYQKRRMHTFVIRRKSIRIASKVLMISAFLGITLCTIKVFSHSKPLKTEQAIKIFACGIKDNRELKKSFDLSSIVNMYFKNQIKRNELAAQEVNMPVDINNTNSVSVSSANITEVNAAKGMRMSNQTGISVNLEELAKGSLAYKIDNSGPQVLIVHTHTTESYTLQDGENSLRTGTDRSTDSEKNMVAVGNVIADILNNNGIETIHDTTVHDYPSYSGAYERSMTTVTNNLSKYPSIKVVLDVHRDGIVKSDGTKVKVCCDINNEKVAQCMFVVGTNAKLRHDNWKENLRLASKLQACANVKYPNLMRPIILRKERFNQQVSKGAIIIEMGSNGNTLDEAKKGAKYMGEILCDVLKS